MNSQMISLVTFMAAATAWTVLLCFIFVYIHIIYKKAAILAFQKRIEDLKSEIEEIKNDSQGV